MENTLNELLKRYDELCDEHLNLNISRGKPCKEQLDLSNEILDEVNSHSSYINRRGNDVRNYGEPTGIDECKSLFASIFGVEQEDVIVLGNSSLNVE